MRYAVLLVGISLSSPAARGEPLDIREQSSHVTTAEVTVDGSPAEIYALFTDYARWPQMLGDIEWVKVEGGMRETARVRFSSKVFEHAVTVVFDNEKDHVIAFHSVDGPPGGRASGRSVHEPVDGGRRTRVTAWLDVHVVGIPRLFISEGRVRHMRDAKLRVDMTDMMRELARHHG